MLSRALILVGTIALLAACGNSKYKGRFISENDTTFSKDIRDASARINKDPYNAELYYLRGNAFYYKDKFADAILDLESAVILDSTKALYHFRLAETALKLDTADGRKAKIHLLAAVGLQPTFHEARLELAKYYIARQEYTEAEKHLKMITNADDVADKAMLFLGICKREQKDTNQSLVYFEKAISLNPQNYEASIQVALLKAALNDPKTLDFFDRALAINEYSDEAFYGKGLYLQKKERYKDALSCYDRAATINKGHVYARYNTAVIYTLFEEWKNAEKWCNEALELDDKFANALALHGFINEKQGNKKAALQDYKAALEIDPANGPAKSGLASVGGN